LELNKSICIWEHETGKIEESVKNISEIL